MPNSFIWDYPIMHLRLLWIVDTVHKLRKIFFSSIYDTKWPSPRKLMPTILLALLFSHFRTEVLLTLVMVSCFPVGHPSSILEVLFKLLATLGQVWIDGLETVAGDCSKAWWIGHCAYYYVQHKNDVRGIMRSVASMLMSWLWYHSLGWWKIKHIVRGLSKKWKTRNNKSDGDTSQI